MAEIRKERLTQISIHNASIFYGPLCVLKNISMEVQKGEFVSLVGLSGCGKTSLLNAIAGFVTAEGDFQVPGKVGVVFQDHAVFPWMTAADNIGFGLSNGERRQSSEIVAQYLRMIRLEDKADKYPAELSGGQSQRIGIARTLATNPDVILMDEPFGALDRHTREQMQGWLLNIWNSDQKTVVFVTHDIEEAIFLSDRVLVINQQTIMSEYEIPFLRPRDDEIKFVPEFVELKRRILKDMEVALE